MFTSVTTRAASAYKRVAVETGVQGADPHQLVGMLYDALLQSMNQARGAIERGEVEVMGAALGSIIAAIITAHIASTSSAWPGVHGPLLIGISMSPISSIIPAPMSK